VRVFFFSTEEVANLGDASLDTADLSLPKKGDNARPRAPCARSSRFFFQPRAPSINGSIGAAMPIPNGMFGKVYRYQTALSARLPSPNGFRWHAPALIGYNNGHAN
jgi:hypothetical protein